MPMKNVSRGGACCGCDIFHAPSCPSQLRVLTSLAFNCQYYKNRKAFLLIVTQEQMLVFTKGFHGL